MNTQNIFRFKSVDYSHYEPFNWPEIITSQLKECFEILVHKAHEKQLRTPTIY